MRDSSENVSECIQFLGLDLDSKEYLDWKTQ